MSFVLAEGEPGLDPAEVCRRIADQTGLQALTREDFSLEDDHGITCDKTGIPINFGITVLLGFIVGSGHRRARRFTCSRSRTSSSSAPEGDGGRQLAARRHDLVAGDRRRADRLRAGRRRRRPSSARLTATSSRLAFFMPWQVLVGTGRRRDADRAVGQLDCRIRRVLVLEPAVVFQG